MPQGGPRLHQNFEIVQGDDKSLVFTVTEFNLLATLMGRPGKVYTRDELVDRVWGPGHAITDRTIDSHIRRIRRKLGAGGSEIIEEL